MKVLIGIVFLTLIIGCGSERSVDDPISQESINLETFMAVEGLARHMVKLPSLTELSLSDFNFSQEVEFLELRRLFLDDPSGTDIFNYEIIKEFDSDIKEALDHDIILSISNSASAYGYEGGCQPLSCLLYLVALVDGDPLIVDSNAYVNELLGDIDRPAELHFIFDSRNRVEYVKETEDGFITMNYWFDCSGNEGVDLYFIDLLGNIVLLDRLIDRKNGEMC